MQKVGEEATAVLLRVEYVILGQICGNRESKRKYKLKIYLGSNGQNVEGEEKKTIKK